MTARALLITLTMCAASCSSHSLRPSPPSNAPSLDVLLDIRRTQDITGAAQHVTLTFRPGDSRAWLRVSSRRDVHHAFRTRTTELLPSALQCILDAARRDGLLQPSSTLRTCYDCTYFSGVVSFDGRASRFWLSDEAMPRPAVRALWALAHLPEP